MNAHVPTDSLVEVTLERDGVAVLTMRDAAGKNAFSRAFAAALTRALEDLGRRADVRVCVVAGLPEAFSAGGDRDVLLGLADGTIAPYDLLLTRALLEVPVPTIAAMAGPAVGGGLVFGLACDMVVMARESRYGANFMDLGFTPGMGATRLVQFAFGEYVGAEMLYGSQYFRGEQLAGRGQVNAVVPRVEVLPRALDMAARIADKPRAALLLLKRALALPRRRAFEEARTVESMMHEVCFADPETVARIRTNYGPGQGG
ncbi:polyketide synthase [Nannocystis sp. ILAH1]|uniref:polyketide synthase n=1 Tax=unclassified Nannocystis TaxID=2627009 RepID=UPI00226D8E12|nr:MULTISPECIES: polyketide synthase [unclassified Nannocystis]MCY0992363.1 polyketide synthase [Nannocystis sp. ILAH1]MCY1069049.1 polyketide synthase [Nannocystis sp. RBIL2]